MKNEVRFILLTKCVAQQLKTELVAFPWQQWFRERAPLLCYMYTVCPVSNLLRCHIINRKAFIFAKNQA
jgi:hypothetical protein